MLNTYVTRLEQSTNNNSIEYVITNNQYDKQYKIKGKKITSAHFNSLHQTDYAFLKTALSTSDSKANVVVTHHVPTFLNYPEQ